MTWVPALGPVTWHGGVGMVHLYIGKQIFQGLAVYPFFVRVARLNIGTTITMQP